MRRSGFSLIELLIVIGILGTVTGMSVPLYRDYQIRNDLDLATEQVVQGLGRAKLLSQSAQDDSGWGFFVPAGVLYKGSDYASRDEAYDETYPMPSTITKTGLMEVSYSKLQGDPSATGSITLTALNEEQRYVDITVQKESIAVVENDRIAVCHYSAGIPDGHTIYVNESAWPALQSQGDTLGVCAWEANISSSSVSSVASSVASSAQSSAAASSAAPATCTDRFEVAEDGTITTTGTVSVTYTVLGSDITYGEGGPEVNVYVSYKKLTGSSYQTLYSGNDVDGGETQTVAGYTNGKKVIVKVRGYYRNSGWLTFDQSFTSDDETGHIVILRDGDELPDYPAFDDQENLNSYLQDILDGSGNIDIGTYDAVMLVELGSITGASADFQDAVILLQFSDPSNC
jgi:prepilin-type N-terminal cleavage/methylation domain-containing protein